MKSKTQNPNHTTLDGNDLLDKYVIDHSDPEPDYLYRLWRATNVFMLHGRMASGRLQGRLLKMFVQMVRPERIVEVGTFSGYSALCMAEGLAANNYGHLYTFEINDEQEPFTRPWLENSPWADRITFIIGNAIEKLPETAKKIAAATNHHPSPNTQHPTPNTHYPTPNTQHPTPPVFDMAFLDGDKRTYIETYDALLPLMRPGGFILADNTLWDGHVIDPAYDRDNQTVGIRRFNDYVASDPRVSKVILPLRDGLTILRIN